MYTKIESQIKRLDTQRQNDLKFYVDEKTNNFLFRFDGYSFAGEIHMIHFNRKVDFYSDNIISSRSHKNTEGGITELSRPGFSKTLVLV